MMYIGDNVFYHKNIKGVFIKNIRNHIHFLPITYSIFYGYSAIENIEKVI
jgi:hypothetical protein